MTFQDSAAALRALARDDARIAPPRYPWRTRILIPAAIVIALLLLVAWSARRFLLPATDVKIVPVVLQPASEAARPAGSAVGKNETTVQAAGWVEPDPYAIAVTALTDGTIGEILMLEGQEVRKGDLLARLIDDDAKLAVARAEAELATRQAELDGAQRVLDHPIDHHREIASTAALLDEAKAELDQLASEIAAEQAKEKELADQLQRLEPLLTKAASEQEIRSTRYKLEAQQAALAAMKARRPRLEAQVRMRAADAKAATENGELRLADKRTLDLAKASLKLAEAELAEATLRLKRTEVRSPADGVVMSLMVERGSKLMFGGDSPTSAYVARLYDPRKLQVRVDVPLADAQKIEIGAPVEVFIESLPGRAIKGEVARAVHQADISKNTLQFKVRLTEAMPALRPEMLARVRFLAKPAAINGMSTTMPDSVSGSMLPFVPEGLVHREGNTAKVVIVDRAAGVARERTITLGQTRRNGWIAVLDGISAGDALIAEPSGMKNEQRVRVAGEFEGTFAKEGS